MPLSNIIGVAADGSPAMADRYKGPSILLQENVPRVRPAQTTSCGQDIL